MKNVVLVLFMLIVVSVFSQYSFEITISSEQNEGFYYTFEDMDNYFISLGGRSIEFGSETSIALIVKYDNSGNIINQKELIKIDTSIVLKYGLQKYNGNYLLMGTLTDSISPYDYDITYICELSPELNLVWEKMYPIPEPYINHSLINYLFNPDNNLIVQGRADSILYAYNDLLLTMVIDLNGNLLDFNLYNGCKDYGTYSDMVFNHDSTGIYLFGNFEQPTSAREWIELDIDLNIIDYLTVIDDDHHIIPPVSVKKLPDDNFIMANKAIMEPGTYHDLYIRIMDSELNTVKDTLIIFPGEKVKLPVYNGLGYTDPDNIWVAIFEDILTNVPGIEVFRFYIFDTNLALKGMKEFGGDTRYWFFNLLPTSDGGCLLTGMVPDFEGSDNRDGYVIKVMPEDILTFAEDTPFDFDRDIMVFPNPFSTEINIQTVRKNLYLKLFDITGNLIISQEIDQIPNFNLKTGNICSGFYFYSIQYKNQTVQSGKLIKK